MVIYGKNQWCWWCHMLQMQTMLFFSNNAATSKLRNWAKTA
jgi:hypothetical protein